MIECSDKMNGKHVNNVNNHRCMLALQCTTGYVIQEACTCSHYCVMHRHVMRPCLPSRGANLAGILSIFGDHQSELSYHYRHLKHRMYKTKELAPEAGNIYRPNAHYFTMQCLDALCKIDLHIVAGDIIVQVIYINVLISFEYTCMHAAEVSRTVW